MRHLLPRATSRTDAFTTTRRERGERAVPNPTLPRDGENETEREREREANAKIFFYASPTVHYRHILAYMLRIAQEYCKGL